VSFCLITLGDTSRADVDVPSGKSGSTMVVSDLEVWGAGKPSLILSFTELIRWTKGFGNPNTEGKDVAAMFAAALDRAVGWSVHIHLLIPLTAFAQWFA
jgi:hypothetical protein